MNHLSHKEVIELDVTAGQVLQPIEADWCRHSVDDASSWRQTILLVEDEPFVREVTREVLQSAGYRVLVAKNATEAGDVYKQRGYEVDLLVTDVILPGETGRVLAARLRRANRGLKTLYVTGYIEQMSVLGTANEDCLAKPFSSDALLERVRRMLDQGGFQLPNGSRSRLACAAV
jgi:two-component system, cell cycle sensor histidine kinase and response regulator CckA